MNPTRAEIDFGKLEFNFRQIKKHLNKGKQGKKIKICGVVKANAYGHGIQEFSRELISLGCDYLGVANYDEAIKLRTIIPDASILVFGTLIFSKLKPKAYVSRLLKYDLVATVASLETARFLDYYSGRIGRKFKVHIKVDTGMKRIGFDARRALKNISQIFTYRNLEIEGIYTHFATSESGDKSFARQQVNRFGDLINELKKSGMEFPIVHSANSGAVLDLPESYFDMVRPGLILYGYYPSDEIKNRIPLKPVMNLKSKVTFIKRVDAHTSISYGRKYFTEKRSFIGSIPVGYGDGYWRALSNRGKVFIKDRHYTIAGAVTMDWIMINLGVKSEVRVGDDVLLIGGENGTDTGADKIAKIVKTIPYEIICSVADRVQRIYINRKQL